MSVVEGGGSSGLIQRVRDILTRPKPTWEQIEQESGTIQGIYAGYVVFLAAITPLIGFLWAVLISPFFGFGAPFVIGGAVVRLVAGYAFGLIGVYVFAWIADQLAPSFGATRGLVPAFKAGAYGMTAAWVSGLFLLVPVIGVLGVLAGLIYTIYLLHLGLGQLMKPAADKAVAYTAAICVATFAIMWAAWWIVRLLT